MVLRIVVMGVHAEGVNKSIRERIAAFAKLRSSEIRCEACNDIRVCLQQEYTCSVLQER